MQEREVLPIGVVVSVTHTAVCLYVVAELYIFRSQIWSNNLYLRQVEPD